MSEFLHSSNVLAAERPSSGTSPQHGLFTAGLSDDRARTWAGERLDQEAGWWCQRAWADAASTDGGPWTLWSRAARTSTYARTSGLRQLDALMPDLPEDPYAAICFLSRKLGTCGPTLIRYLSSQLASSAGWTAHALWRFERGQEHAVAELLALRMALDVLYAGAAAGDATVHLPDPAEAAELTARIDAHRLRWQRALELTGSEQVLPLMVDAEDNTPPTEPEYAHSQSLWCIDVRSERIRRHLERAGAHQTFGIAGFFNVPTRHQDADGVGRDQCPVLLVPPTGSATEPTQLTLAQAVHRSYQGALSVPVVPLQTAEVFGLVALAGSAVANRIPAAARAWRQRVTRGRDAAAAVTWQVETSARADAVESVLRSIGLVSDFAPVVMVVGHGATVENNAHAATYQCGACGANTGAVNSRLFVEAMNDPAVRAELRERGIEIPEETRAVAALHDTATDRVALEGTPDVDPRQAEALSVFLTDVADAGRRTAAERRAALVATGTPSVAPAAAQRELVRRTSDWAEPTPEWGLAGNIGIIVAPRRLTKSLNLRGQFFLQSYDESLDPDHTILAGLMAAPVVVSQWISAQYQFSAVAPQVFGAGDKTTLNVVGNIGVLSGAHGDLKVGLPWQSLFDQDPAAHPDALGAHAPRRHLVVVAAKRDAIASIVLEHQGLRELVTNGWISVVAIDQGAHQLGADLRWRAAVAPVMPAAGQPVLRRG